MRRKRDVTLKGEWLDFAAKLPERLRGKVLDALTRYALTGEMPDADTETERAVMRCVEPSAERARRISEARRRANAARTTRAGGNPAFAKGKPNPYYPKKDNCKDNDKDNNKTAFRREKSRCDKGKDNNKNRAAAGETGEKDNNKITTKSHSRSYSNANIKKERMIYPNNLHLLTNYSIPTDKYILYIYPSSLEERQRVGIDNGVHIDNIDGMDRMNIEAKTCNREDRAMNEEDKTEGSERPMVFYSDGERTIPFDEADIEYMDQDANLEAYARFSKRWKVVEDVFNPGEITACDWRKIEAAFERSSWLRGTPICRSLKWLAKNHIGVEGGVHDDATAAKVAATEAMLDEIFNEGGEE